MQNAAAQKGTRYEASIVKKLTEATGVKFARTPLSGAGAMFKGDIFIDPREGRICLYSIECKHYQDEQVTSNLLLPGTQIFWQWWQQQVDQAINMKTKPMLIYHKDRGKDFVALDELVEGVNYIHVVKKEFSVYIYLFTDVIPVLKDTLYK